MSRNYKTCVVCGKSFPCPPSDKTVTCSKECSRIHRSQVRIGKPKPWGEDAKNRIKGRYPPALKFGTEAASKSPRAGGFDANVSARGWTIASPTGKVYSFRNLQKWCREHADLFGEPLNDNQAAYRIASGFRQIKRSYEGKRGDSRPVSQYKGWHLLSWTTSEAEENRKKREKVCHRQKQPDEE